MVLTDLYQLLVEAMVPFGGGSDDERAIEDPTAVRQERTRVESEIASGKPQEP